MDRRTLLARLATGVALTISPLLPSASFAARPKPAGLGAALLLPLTGERAGLGASMARAAALAQAPDAAKGSLVVLDTLGTPAGAAAAAQRAVRQGARLLLGPLTAAEVPAALAAAGSLPLLSFTNDERLRGSGAFLLGVTPSQTAAAALQYARRRGVRRVATLAGDSAWAAQSVIAARRSAADTGLTLGEPQYRADLPVATMLAALRSGGDLPDAVYLPEPELLPAAHAAALRQSGVQLLGALQTFDYATTVLAGLSGAWLAAPDPDAFADFSQRYEAIHGSPPGMIAKLAYDAVMIARAIATSGQPARAALLAAGGFPAVTGAPRFRTDGSASRTLSIVTAEDGNYRTIDSSIGA